MLSVGMGAIGTSYLKKAAALGATCYGVRRTLHDQPDFVEQLVTPEGMDDLLPMMDVVALSLPGTAAVDGMFDERRLRLMKPTAILVNVGRGNSVVTEDLIRVMNSGHLKAACLDVMDPEPLPKDHPLWMTSRVYITPHISGGYRAGVNYDRVIDTKIWADEKEIEVRLKSIVGHMADVIQRCLQGRYDNIMDYNKEAGINAEPLRFLMIMDFPENFTDKSISCLESIINNGSKTGVYTIIAANKTEIKRQGYMLYTQESTREGKMRFFPLPSPTFEQIIDIVDEFRNDIS